MFAMLKRAGILGLVLYATAIPGLCEEEATDQEEATEEKAADDSLLHPRLEMTTSLGDILLELDGEKAPISTMNFIRYAEEGFYVDTLFHRVIADFMIQGGGFTPDLKKKEDGLHAGIKNEWKNGVKNKQGTIAMARVGRQPDSGTSQFFINVKDNDSLDQPRDGAGYAVFGKVVEGMETVEKIRTAPVESHRITSNSKAFPSSLIIIQSVKFVDHAQAAYWVKKVQDWADEEAARLQEEIEAVRGKQQELIDRFEKETGKKVEMTESGLMYVVLEEGEGPTPKPTDTVEVHYEGRLLNGTKFDSSYDRGETTSFPLNGVIAGWTEGVGMMKVGGKRKLIIPGNLAYGKRGTPPDIPPDATLVFDIKLVSIK